MCLFQARHLPQHQAEEKCNGCEQYVAFCQRDNHSCKPCILGCGLMVQPGVNEAHKHSIVCLRALCDCRWHEIGCTMKVYNNNTSLCFAYC